MTAVALALFALLAASASARCEYSGARAQGASAAYWPQTWCVAEAALAIPQREFDDCGSVTADRAPNCGRAFRVSAQTRIAVAGPPLFVGGDAFVLAWSDAFPPSYIPWNATSCDCVPCGPPVLSFSEFLRLGDAEIIARALYGRAVDVAQMGGDSFECEFAMDEMACRIEIDRTYGADDATTTYAEEVAKGVREFDSGAPMMRPDCASAEWKLAAHRAARIERYFAAGLDAVFADGPCARTTRAG